MLQPLVMMHTPILQTSFLVLILASTGFAAEVTVSTPEELRQAFANLRPSNTVVVNPGEYGSGYAIRGIQGSSEEPVIIAAANADDPPRFTGGTVALHVQGCSHLYLRRLRVQGQKGNGINIDDVGGPSHHITLSHIDVSDIGPKGNCDGIKLSGITDFRLLHCRVSGWGGEGVDMVGCHRGLIEDCHFAGKEGFSQATGTQTKGGSEDIVMRSCTFIDAGQRPAQIGGSTGRPYFRPPTAVFEARNITVEGCLIVGGMTGVAFAGVDGATVRFNTIVNPTAWALRILQENQEPGMIACRNGRFEDNLVVIDRGALRTWVNIGPETQPQTFTFARNGWYHHGTTQSTKPHLPATEANGTYGIDPQLDPAAGYKPRISEAQKAGHLAFTMKH